MFLQKLNKGFITSPHPYPSDDVHKNQKDRQWHLKYIKAFYHSHVNEHCAVDKTRYDDMVENRKYCDGAQSPDKYKNILLDLKEENQLSPAETQQVNWMNVNFEDIVVVLPKFYKIFAGIFSSQQHEIMADAIDKKSMEEKELKKWRAYVMSKEKALLEFIDNVTGNQTQLPEQAADNIDELVLMEEMGSLKIPMEMMIEAALKDVENRSNWDEIESDILKDIFENNIIAVRDYTNVMTGMVECQRIDPLDLTYTLDENKEVAKAGVFKRFTIANLRKELASKNVFECEGSPITEDYLKNLAVTYGGIFGNRSTDMISLDPREDKTYEYDDFIIYVFEGEWACNDSTFKTMRQTKHGNTLIYEEQKMRTDTENRKTVQQSVKVFRQAKWVIGSEIVWDWGLAYDIPRPKESEARSSFSIRRLPGKSMVEANKLHADQIQLCHLRLQNAVAMAPNSGLAYEYSSLQGMSLGEKGAKPLDLIRMRNQTGNVVYKATVHRGGMISPNIGNPIFELKGGIGPLLQELIQIITISLESIRENTGLNAVVDASTPQQDQGLGVSQIAMAATNNSLKPIYNSYIFIRNRLAQNCAMRIQLIAKYKKEYPGYFRVLGRTGWEILKITSDVAYVNYGFKIQALPNQKHIQDIEVAAANAVKAGTLTWGEYITVKRMILAGSSLKYVQAFIVNREVKKAQEMQQMQQQNIEQNAQVQQQSAQQAVELESQLEQMKSGFKREEETHKTNELIRLKEAEAIIEATYAIKNKQRVA
jgi:hypothetical protein